MISQAVQVSPTVTAAVVLDRIAYWQRYAVLERGGDRWVAKTQAEWARETGLSPRQVKRAMAALRASGLIRTEQHFFGSRCMTWTRLVVSLGGPPPVSPGRPPRVSPYPEETSGETSEIQDTAQERREEPVRERKSTQAVLAGLKARDEKLKALDTLEEAMERASRDGSLMKDLEACWRIGWIRAERGFYRPWTREDQRKVKHLAKLFPPEVLPRLLAEAAESWSSLCGELEQKAKTKGPEGPHIGFLLKHAAMAAQWLQRRLEYEKPQSTQEVVEKKEPSLWDKI